MKRYFAYGSCANVASFRETVGEGRGADRFTILGVGVLKDHRLAFTRYAATRGGGVLDIIESPGDRVLGVVYEVPEDAVRCIDAREGHPNAYVRREGVKVSLGWEEVEVFTYTVRDRDLQGVKPTKAYVDLVLEGMKDRFPAGYVNRYLLAPLREQYGMEVVDLPLTIPYHFDPRDKETAFQRDNRDFYDLILQMAAYFGDDDRKAQAVMPTPQMFRLLVKLTEMAARDRLDYGHMIPREIHNLLAAEFSKITGVEAKKLQY